MPSRVQSRTVLSRGAQLFAPLLVTLTADKTLSADEQVALVDTTAGNVTVTLPAVTTNYAGSYTIKKLVAANTVTIATTGAATIDGAATHSLTTQYDGIEVVADATNWHIIGGMP